uniref:Uncharacterized protein n=1 Tax=Echinococcus granulosus TaxID=6210 RepID=A0A068WY26_ECHGR|nr:hypothetical protein EgrG_002056400 [Echinococcus granulosus]
MTSMFDELPFVSAPDSDTASDSGNDRDGQKDRKWKCVPTNNPLRLRLKKSVSDENEKTPNDAQPVSTETAGVDWDSMCLTSTAVSAFTSTFTADSKSVSSSASTTSRRCANQKDGLDDIDLMNRLKLTKCGILKMPDTVVEVISTWQTASTGSHYAFSFLISQFDKGGTRSALPDGVEHRDQQSDIIFQ